MQKRQFDPPQLTDMLDVILPHIRVVLTKQHADGILERIKKENLTPFDEGVSLHCWNADYMIDGGHYSVCGVIGNDDDVEVELLRPRC